MDEAGGRLAFQRRPYLLREHTFDLFESRERMKEAQHEPEAGLLAVGQKFHGYIVGEGDMDLAVADHAVAAILEAGQPVAFDAHLPPLSRSFQSDRRSDI
jgi:hypothetical protein